jgi:S-adenosylmethionine hydrolase
VASPAQAEGPHYFVGPDNGLLPWAVDVVGGADRAVEIRRVPGPDSAGAWGTTTFDGRDVFAPAAARLWQGVAMEELGAALDPADLVRLTAPRVSTAPGSLEAEVLWVDGFGNVQLAARPADAGTAKLDTELELEVVGAMPCRVRRVRAFAELGPGELGLIVDANGHLSFVCDRQPAATVLGVQPGDIVMVRVVDSGCVSP